MWLKIRQHQYNFGRFHSVLHIISPPEPLGYWWAYSIGRPLSSVCIYVYMYVSVLSIFSNIFFSETTGLNEAKFHVEPSWDGWTKVCSNGLGHMTKMAAMPIYGKNLKKSSCPGPKGWWPWNLVFSIGCMSYTNFVQMMTLGWPWPISRQSQICSLMLLYGIKVKQWIFFRNYWSLWYQNW